MARPARSSAPCISRRRAAGRHGPTSIAPSRCCTPSSTGPRWKRSTRCWRPTPAARWRTGALRLCHWGNPFAGVKAGPPLERGLEAAQKGLATGAPTPREKAYIAAVSELYKNAATVPHRDRTLAYAKCDGRRAARQPERRRGEHLLCPGGEPDRPADGQDLRGAAPGRRDSRAAVAAVSRSSRPAALHHSRLRPSAAGREGAGRRAPLREDRAVGAARAPHAVAHLHARRLLEGVGRDQHRVGAGHGAEGRT